MNEPRQDEPRQDEFPRKVLYYRHVNFRGLLTLCEREVRRFLAVWVQTVATPAIAALIFLTIFSLALGKTELVIGGLSFDRFIMPGLVIMGVVQNAFANTSSSLLTGKLQGSIVDLLMPPLSALELTLGLLAGGAVRGMLVGVLVILALLPFVETSVHSLAFVVYNIVCAAVLLSALGIAAGLWSEKFEHVAALNSFVIVPLSFLSGTFFQLTLLPEPFRTIAHLDPLFYLVDGCRYGFTGVSEIHPLVSAVVLFFVTLLCVFGVGLLIKRGYRLRH